MATQRPCPTHKTCPQLFGPAAQFTEEFPFANLSAEAPDPRDYVVTWFNDYVPGDPPDNNPTFWNNPYGPGYGSSTVSRDDAVNNAQDNAADNTTFPLVGNQPQTCAIQCAGGGALQHTIAANRIFAPTQAEANARARSLCQTEGSNVIVCFITSILPGSCVDVLYTFEIRATGGSPHAAGYMYFWEIVSGVLPPGITMNPITGVLYGTPSVGGAYSFTVKITDGIGTSQTRDFTINVVQIVTASPLVSGIVGTAYSAQFTSLPATGTIAWTVGTGSLPGGLTLSGAGLLSGTPTGKGDFSFFIQCTTGGQSCSKEFTLKIWDADNTNVLDFGTSEGSTIALGSFGPGMFKVDFRNTGGTVRIFGYLGGGVCDTGPMLYATLGCCSGCTGGNSAQMVLNPIGNLPGYTASHPSDVTAASNAAKAGMLAMNPLMVFELTSPTALSLTTPILNPGTICGCSPITYDGGGGSGNAYSLIRIGKP